MYRHRLRVITGIVASFIVVLNSFIPIALAQANGQIRSLRGFAGANAAAEHNWEEKMRSIPRPELLRDYMKHLSAEPHHVGSNSGRVSAEFTILISSPTTPQGSIPRLHRA